MIIPIKCFTCGTVLADKYRFYCEEVRRLKLLKHKKQNLDNIYIEKVIYLTEDFFEKTEEAKVLDSLGLNKMCCRTQMLTHVDIIP